MRPPPDCSWIRFHQGTITGFGRPYTVDGQGGYHCEICDRPLDRKARRCGVHR